MSSIYVMLGLAVLVVYVRWRKPYVRPASSLNIWFGPLPRHGENQTRYYLKDAMYALACLVVLVLPLLLLSQWDLKIDIRTGESANILVILIILIGLALMAFFAFASCLAKAFFLSLFGRRRVFDESLGKFVQRNQLSASQAQSRG